MKRCAILFAILATMFMFTGLRAEEKFGFSIAGIQVSDENYFQLDNVLKWANFLLSGNIDYAPETNTLTLDNAYVRYPFGKDGIRNESCQNLTIVVKGACKLVNAIFDSGYSAVSACRETHIIGTPADTLYIEGGMGTDVTREYDGNTDLYFESLTVDFDIHTGGGRCFKSYYGAKNYINRATIIAHQFANDYHDGFGTNSLVFSEGWGFVYPVGVYYDEEKGMWVNKDGSLIASEYWGYKNLPNPIQVIIRSLDEPFKESNVWIASKRINELNNADVLGDGTINYDFATKTLHLSDATIQGSGSATGDVSERGTGIYIEESDVTIDVQGICTVTGDTECNALWFGSGCRRSGIAGDGTLKLVSDYIALFDNSTGDTLTIGGNVMVEADGGIVGLQRYRRAGVSWYNTLRITDFATVKAMRSISPGIESWKELLLENEHEVTAPEGAYWDAEQHEPLHADGSRITGGEWVVIDNEKYITGVSSLLTSPEEEGQSYNMAGQKVGEGYKGIVIKDGKKVLVK